MENKEKFAFRKVKMSEGVEVEFIKLLTSVETKNDEDVIKAFKVQLSSGVLTCHAEMLSRTPSQIIFQTSQFSKPYNFYKNWELWVFSNILGVCLTQGIKECITAPVLTLDPTKPEPIKRAEMILDNFSQEDSPVVATVIAPGNFIQMILPKHEILLSVMFIYKERNTYVQLIIQKLAYEREKTTTKTNGSASGTEG